MSFHGRFDKLAGEFTLDEAQPENSKFSLSIDPAAIYTGNDRRDDHLRNADFFNAKKHPEITFRSTKVEAAKDGDWEVTGDLTLLGVTKPVTAKVRYGGTKEDPRAGMRAGFDGTFRIDRRAFGMEYGAGALGDEVTVHIGLTGTAK